MIYRVSAREKRLEAHGYGGIVGASYGRWQVR